MSSQQQQMQGDSKLQAANPFEEEKTTGEQTPSDPNLFNLDGPERELSNLELVKMAEEYADKLELEKAIALLDEGIRRFPNDTLVIDQYTDLLIQFGEGAKAKELIERSIQLNPEQEGQKYLNLAEMLKGHEAVQMYKRGIQVLLADISRHQTAQNVSQVKLCTKQQASALTSIAELYMTEPLCDEPEAEQTCEQNLAQALQIHEGNLDALQCMANLRMLRNKDGEAKQLLQKVVNKVKELKEKLEKDTSMMNIAKAQQSSGASKTDKDVDEMPSVEFRMQTSRFLVELQMFKQGLKVLESVINEDDETVEAWYLLAFCLFKLKKYTTAEECCKNVQQLAVKFKVVNPELEAGTLEIYEGIKKELAKQGSDPEKMQEDGNDDGFETMSEEDISSGEDNDQEMKE